MKDEAPERYGQRRVPKMYAQVNAHRAAVAAEGTPLVQETWDKIEEHIDFAYQKNAPLTLAEVMTMPEVRAFIAAAEALRADMIERGKWKSYPNADNQDVTRHKLVNAGFTVWHDFNAALAHLKGDTP
jgi:hypothetical protein